MLNPLFWPSFLFLAHLTHSDPGRSDKKWFSYIKNRDEIYSTTAEGWGRTRVWLHAILHALFKRPVEGLDRGRLTRGKAHSAPFFAPCQMRLSA